MAEELSAIANNQNDTSKLGAALGLDGAQIEKVVARQQEKNILFGEAAKELGLISETQLKKALSEQFGFSYAAAQEGGLSKLLTAAYSPFSREVEGIKSLRSQLLIRWFNKANKTLTLASASHEDGASTLAANLAILFSQLNKNTLLIDANLRKPNQQSLFAIKTKLGLANILANRQGEYQLKPQKSMPNLTVLSAGTEAPNPQELLNRDSLSQLIEDLEKVYDVILIDTSPANLGDDYLSVISKTKAVMLIARKGVTLISELELIKSNIAVTDAELLGAVLQEL